MQKLSLFVVLAAASFAVVAQPQDRRSSGAEQQQSRTDQPTQGAGAAADRLDPAAVERARTDGSAGGTAPVPPERRQAVGAGAGPHLHDTSPSPQKLPKDQPVEPGK
jgi:hypothetical protein